MPLSHSTILRRLLPAAAVVVALGTLIPGAVRDAQGEEVTLRTVSAWREGTAFSRAFERFIDRVNETGKGVIQIDYLGGGSKIMNVFEMGQALKTGVFDMINTNSAYYGNLMPVANVLKLTREPMSEIRKNGVYDYLEEIYNEKLHAHWLGRGKGDVPFHVYLGDSVDELKEPDFSGLKLRTTPNYAAFFTRLGATLVRTQGSGIYTALERGVVDGYGWPIQGIDELGLLPVTKFRIDPGFFVAPNEILINLDMWNSLTPEQKNVLEDAQAWTESWLPEYEEKEDAKARELQAEAGIKVIEFKGEEAERYLEAAYDAAWDELVKLNPKHGPKLRELMTQN